MFDLAALADAGRVDQGDRQAIEFDFRIGRVARGAGDRADNRALFSDQLIQQTRLCPRWACRRWRS